jgi:hypothetical protein
VQVDLEGQLEDCSRVRRENREKAKHWDERLQEMLRAAQDNACV